MNHQMSMDVHGTVCEPGHGASRVAEGLADSHYVAGMSKGALSIALWLAYVQGRADQAATAQATASGQRMRVDP